MRSTGVHLVDGRCTLVVVDHDDVEPRVVDHRTVDLAPGVVINGRVADADALAGALSDMVGAVRGQVVAAWWPDDAVLTTIDCTGAGPGTVGEAVDRVVVERFGADRPSVVLRKVIASGRELTTVGACRSSDVENARRSLLMCGLDQASLLLAPAALAIFTRSFDTPTVLAVGGDHVALLYGFAGWPFVGGALESHTHEPVVEVCGVGALTATQYRSLRPPLAHLGPVAVLESCASLESIARDLLTPAFTSNDTETNGAADGPLLDSVTGEYLVALGAALWGAAAVADLVPSGLAVLPGNAVANGAGIPADAHTHAAVTVAAPVTPVAIAGAAPASTDEAPESAAADAGNAPSRRKVLIVAVLAVLALMAVGAWWAASGDEVTPSAVPTADSIVATTSTDAVNTSTSITATSSPSPPPSTTIEAPPALPFVAHAHGGVYRQGKLYLEGTLPSRAAADAFVKKAAAVIGAANVVDNYVIDSRAPAPSSGFVRVDEPFLFPTGSDALDPRYLGVLDLGVIVMQQNAGVRMVVTGHTDSVGDEEANQRLSLRRANAVIDYVVSKGIDRSRFDAVGKGETSPIADNAFEAGRQLNRRIEVELLGLLDAT